MDSKRKSNRLFSLFIMTCLIYSSLGIASPTVSGAEVEPLVNSASPQTLFSDVEGHWAEKPVKEWTEAGLIQGYQDRTFRPDRSVNRGEAIALVNRSFGFKEQTPIHFSDLAVSDWEYEDVAKAVRAGYVEGYANGTIGTKQPISRQEAAVMITRLLGLEANKDSAAANVFTDVKLLPQWSKGAVAAITAAKIMEGYEDGSFKPQALITRAEVIVTLDRALKSKTAFEYNQAGTYGPKDGIQTISGNVVVNAIGVTLQNMKIAGNLLLAEGIEEGDMFLRNVTVMGTTTVNGGGKNSIHVENSVLATVIVDRAAGTVRIVVKGQTSIAEVIVKTPVILEQLSSTGSVGINSIKLEKTLPEGSKVTLIGSFDHVDVAAKSIVIEFSQGVINQLSVAEQAGDTSINLGKEAKILALILDAITKVRGQGVIDRATLSEKTKGTTFEKQPLLLEGPGVESRGQKDSPVTSNPTTSTPVTSTPGTDTPGTDTPGTDTPGTDTPGSGGGNNGGGDGGTVITPVGIASVSAINGRINVALDGTPDTIPTINNFTVQKVINVEAAIAVTPSLITWDPISKTAALTVPIVPPSESEQSIVYQVSYKGATALGSAAFVVRVDNEGVGIYVDAVNGSDLNSGSINFPFKTIEKAKDTARLRIRNMTEDVIVYLRGGTYPLTRTLQFDQGDSGTNGYNVIYKNYNGETPIISGGKTITGWSLHDDSKNIWEVSVDASLETRQIYVNGTRAIRAKSANGLPGAVLTASGYTTTDTNMQNWGNKSDIEFVYKNLWIEPRVGVANISGTTITMKQPAWDMAFQGGAPLTIKPDGPSPTYIENAYELLDEEGEWYLDRSARKLYYKPRAGENMDTAEVVAAYLNTLVSGSGNLDNPVHNIQFEGITFAYATWLNPNGNEGYTPIQASVYSKPYASAEYSYDLDNWIVMPANLSFSMAKNIRFERNKFIHLGASALAFSNGSQDNVISGNEFTDVSGTAVQIGGVSMNDSYPQDLRYLVKNNQVTNNYIHQIAVEYRGCVGVFVGYTEGTLVSHNEIVDLPYTAITMGWGWGDRDFADKPDRVSKAADQWRILYNVPSASKNNVISHNHIHDIMSYLKDGGGIYNLGAQPGGVIEGNYIHGVHDEYGAIYLDSGSRYLTVANNILHNYVRNFINSYYDNDVEFNYWNEDNGYWWEKTGLVANNYKIESGNVPSSILDNVGLETAYADLLSRPSVNFALGKPVAAYNSDGTPATKQLNTDFNNAVDGDPSTIAVAANELLWTMEVDLGNSYLVDRVVTTFMSTPQFYTSLWATDYEIQVSETGENESFTTVKTISGSIGGVDEQVFIPVNARYVRIVAIKPDGPGQTGSQMAIAELAVYGKVAFIPSELPDRAPAIIPIYNLALGKKASAYYNDGTVAMMQGGAEADKAVDGNSATTSIATNQYAWTLEVDLGSIYNINRVKTLFASGLYASEYEIQVSTTGSSDSFITVKTVMGSTGGVSEETFVPVNAKYVRIKALKPDGGNQTGSQMAISELEVYEYFNYSLNKTATAYYSNGSLAAMQPGHETDKSVDGDITSGAMAANEYAWMEVVDLGHVFDIERISVIFGENHWPTDFEVAISNDGVNYSLIDHLTNFGVETPDRGYGYWLSKPIMQVEARYVRVKANKPDGPNQTGTRMQISEISVYAADRAVKMSQKTDNQVADKNYYRTISNQSFTFEAGDVIEYDVKLNTEDAGIGGIDIKNTDQTVFGAATWQDQNGITGTPWNDLRAKAFGKWYHRELSVPDAMVGKTSAGWMLAFENNSVSKVLQATYDNIVVKRGGNSVLTVYKSGQPQVNIMDHSSHFDTDAPVGVINRK